MNDVDYVVNLGDTIEGYSTSSSPGIVPQSATHAAVPATGHSSSTASSFATGGALKTRPSRRIRRLLRRGTVERPGGGGSGGGVGSREDGGSGSASGGRLGENVWSSASMFTSSSSTSSVSSADCLLAAFDDLRFVVDTFSRLHMPVFHVLGNHCRCLPHADLCRMLRIHGRGYYSVDLTDTWKLLVLHTAELHAQAVDARPGIDDDLLADIVSSEGRPPDVSFHGAMSDEQLDWLQRHVDEARVLGQRVIVVSHYPLADGAARESHVLANTTRVRHILEAQDTPVVLCLAGHDHLGGYLYRPRTRKRGAVTYVTMPAMLEATQRMQAFAFVTGFTDGSVIVSAGPNSPASCAIDASELYKLDE